MKASVKQLTMNLTYSSLVHPLTDDEYSDLKESISENGQYIPIIANELGVVLDGHHRLKICRELGIQPKKVLKKFDSPLLEQLFVIDCNLKRRHLNPYQKGVLTLKKKPIYERMARQNMSLGGKGDKNLTPLNRVNEKLGKEVGISYETIRKIETIQEKASEEDKEKLNRGQKTINKIFRKIEKEEKRQELMKLKPIVELPKNIQLLYGDFREKAREIKSNSIDLIFTDPPYDLRLVSLYSDLGKIASRVLKDGGSLVIYASQYHLPQVIESLKSENLRYWWTLCSKLRNYKSLVHRRLTFSEWKPLLWYVKGAKPKYSTDSISDYILTREPDKDLYRYQQSIEEAEYIIRHLTVENQIVFDPMFGSGTSCIAALGIKRKFIGCEKDKAVLELAKRRISKYVDH